MLPRVDWRTGAAIPTARERRWREMRSKVETAATLLRSWLPPMAYDLDRQAQFGFWDDAAEHLTLALNALEGLGTYTSSRSGDDDPRPVIAALQAASDALEACQADADDEDDEAECLAEMAYEAGRDE